MSLPIVLVPHPHVRVDAKVLAGSPHVVGSRVLVRRLYAFYKNGARIETILRRYPQLEPAMVFDALAFALDNLEVIEADLEREREMLERTGAKPSGSSGDQRQIEFTFAPSSPATVRSRTKGKPGAQGGSR
jgi:uncharacterized protein (DUF433 family)